MNYLKKASITFLLLGSVCIYGQDITVDNKGGQIFSMPVSIFSPKLSSNTIGISFPITKRNPKKYLFHDTATVVKTKNLFGNISIINNTGSVLDFSKKANITPHIEIGYSFAIDTFYRPQVWSGTYYNFSASVFVDYQNFNGYDKTTKAVIPNYISRISPGAKAFGNIFYKDLLALSVSASYKYSVNTTSLTSYQEVTSSYYSDANISSNGTTDGYLLPIAPKNSYRLGFSLPIFGLPIIKKYDGIAPNAYFKLKYCQIVFVPYYFFTTENFSQLAHNSGIAFNLMPRIRGTEKFTIANAISVGYNIINSAQKDKQRYFFISGTFTLGSLPKPAVISN